MIASTMSLLFLGSFGPGPYYVPPTEKATPVQAAPAKKDAILFKGKLDLVIRENTVVVVDGKEAEFGDIDLEKLVARKIELDAKGRCVRIEFDTEK